MAFTYSGDPSNNLLDRIRLEIGDTDSSDPLLQDEEIQYVINEEKGFFNIAARCCEIISRNFAREADKTLGPLSIQASQKSQAYKELAAQLRKKASKNESVPPTEFSACSPIFYKGMMQN